jgi:hypothetical protein
MKNNTVANLNKDIESIIIKDAQDYALALLSNSPLRDMAFLFKQRNGGLSPLIMIPVDVISKPIDLPESLRPVALEKDADAFLLILFSVDKHSNGFVWIEIETNAYYIIGTSKIRKDLERKLIFENFHFTRVSLRTGGANWILPSNQKYRTEK